MPLEIFLSFLFASVVFGLIPGPSVLFTIASGVRLGIFHTLPSIFGQLIANTLQIILIFFGLHALLEQSATCFFLLKLIGAAYLIYLGICQIISRKPFIEQKGRADSKGMMKSLFSGFLVCGTNPKALIYYAAFFPQFIVPEINETLNFLILGVTSILVYGLVLMIYTLIAGKMRYFLIEKGYWRIQNRITGGLMIGAGATLAVVSRK